MENRARACGNPGHGACPPPYQVRIFTLRSRGNLSFFDAAGMLFFFPLAIISSQITNVDFYVVSQEPAWVRANRVKNATQAQDLCTKQLLRTISGGERTLMEVKKLEPPGG